MAYIYNNKTTLRELLKMNGLKAVKAGKNVNRRDIIDISSNKTILHNAKACEVFNLLAGRKIFK